ncbi:conserved hypothetical protein [Ricinus communis]|uniref:Uncharacterized protein n=1 Tax=Ricinus communis TaxID=3988 RepID=B9RS39_RICCO|nr:conserved hypothetical protein [Ricinus communis]
MYIKYNNGEKGNGECKKKGIQDDKNSYKQSTSYEGTIEECKENQEKEVKEVFDCWKWERKFVGI